MSAAKKKKEVVRTFGISNFAVDNSTSIFILTFLIFIGGLIAYKSMPPENFPEIVIPKIYVGTTYPGNSPVDIENLITRHLEKEMKSLKGVKKITSTSVQDYSTIVVEFNTDVDADKALQDVKDAADKAKSDMPTDLDREPNIFKMEFSEFPILNVNLSGDLEMDVLKDHAEFLQDEIEKLPEISEVDIKGAPDKEVKIQVDVFKMNSLEISFNDIENAIKSENVTISGGDLLTDEVRRNIRVVGEFASMEQIGNVIVKSKDGQAVFLRDIATVSYNYEDAKSYARMGHLPVVSLDVKKRSGENLVEAVDKINLIVAHAKEHRFPKGMTISMTNDQSTNTRNSLTNLENSIISGVILVVLVLLFFMGLRNALFVGIAIPLSMLMGFIVLSALGITLNTMVLFSLILALGMLVDNGIVVVENIYRMMAEEGKSMIQASKQGVGEVAVPIIASTATTVAAFLPLVFWDSIMGEFMKYLPITLMVTLSASLFVALVINPVLTKLFMKKDEPNKKVNYRALIISVVAIAVLAGIFYVSGSKAMGNGMVILLGLILLNSFALRPGAAWFQFKALPKLEAGYSRIIRFALRGWNPAFFLLGTFALLILSFVFVGIRSPKTTFFPEMNPKYVNVFLQMPLGTDIDKTNALAERVEYKLDSILAQKDSATGIVYNEIVDAIIANVGEGTSDPMEDPSGGRTPHKARITVSFVDFEDRQGLSSSDAMKAISDGLGNIPGVTITVAKDRNGPPVGKPINIEVSGEDYDKLIDAANNLRNYLDRLNVPGVEDLKTDLEEGKPELLVDVDRAAARRYGVSTAAVATAIRTSLFGKEVSKYKEGEDDYPIMIRFQENVRYDLQAILNQRISFRDPGTGKQVSVPIAAVATIKYTSSYGSIKRKDLDRVIAVWSYVKEGYNANEIIEVYRNALTTYKMPEGYTFRITGEQEEQAASMDFLKTAFLIALGLVFLIIVAQFNSVASPVIIMLTVVFSTIGVLLGIAIFNMEIVILMTGIGIISLAGVVVNNAIVLMDYTDLLRKRRREELGLRNQRLPHHEIINSVAEAGRTRLRPVLLTATTTILGLIPLAIGLNINFITLLTDWDPQIYIGGDNVAFWGPMSWTVIFGLTFATFLTLVIVPVMYLSFDATSNWLLSKVRKAEKEYIDEPEEEDEE
ncbi:efflux RND transporter permease subunit [soil metagenome]